MNLISVTFWNCFANFCTPPSPRLQVTRLCDLSPDSNTVTSVSWNERGNTVAVGTHHGYVTVWDVAANKQVSHKEY